MRLHADWKHILKHAWSVRWMACAGVFGTGEMLMPLYIEKMPVGIFAVLTLVCIVGGLWSRTLIQPKDGL